MEGVDCTASLDVRAALSHSSAKQVIHQHSRVMNKRLPGQTLFYESGPDTFK